MGVLEIKANANSHLNINSIKAAIKEEWKKKIRIIHFEGLQIIS